MADPLSAALETTALRPWRVQWSETFSMNGQGHIYLIDATGRKIAAIWGKAEEKADTAALIVRAVNAYDRAMQMRAERSRQAAE